MKTLLVLRHASADRNSADRADLDRALDTRGETEAAAVGAHLSGTDSRPDRILCSSALRTQQTAELVASCLNDAPPLVTRRRLYLAEPAVCLAALRETPDEVEVLLLVGHNPGLEMMINQLARRPVGLGTATLVRLDLAIDRWVELDERTEARLSEIWRPCP